MSESITRFKLIAGLDDKDIKEDILSMKDQDLEETVKCVENKESGKVARRKVGVEAKMCLWSGQKRTPTPSHPEEAKDAKTAIDLVRAPTQRTGRSPVQPGVSYVMAVGRRDTLKYVATVVVNRERNNPHQTRWLRMEQRTTWCRLKDYHWGLWLA